MKSFKEEASDQLSIFLLPPIDTDKSFLQLTTIPDTQQKIRTNHMSKFKPFHEFQRSLIGLCSESFLDYIDRVMPKDHLCRVVKEVVFSLDTEQIEGKYCFSGQKSYHPKLMLSLLFYGYATGLRSSRKLEERCISDHIYIYLMQCYTPDHRTISDFRKDNLEAIERYFIDIVRIVRELGYSNIGKICIDGTKIKANASAKRSKDEAGYRQWLSKLEEDIHNLLQEAEIVDDQEDCSIVVDPDQEELKRKLSDRNYLKNKIEEAINILKEDDSRKKVNLSDRDSNNMKAGGSKDIRPSYNCQASVTEEGFILAASSVSESNDKNQLEAMIDQTESNTGHKVEEVAADSGYGSYSTYEYLEEKELDGYIPDGYFKQCQSGLYEKEEYRYHNSNFKYDDLSDSYICPEGKRLRYWKTRKNKSKTRQWNHKVYRGIECASCLQRSLCTKSKVRELLIDIREPLLQKMRRKLQSKEGSAKYLKRQYTIEPVFGHLKYNLGYRNFLLRGLKKVNAEFKLMCIGWNLKKMASMGFMAAM